MKKNNIFKENYDEKDKNSDIPKFKLKDPISFLTHFIAFIVSIFLLPVLLIYKSMLNANLKSMVSLSIFMISMILLYGASSTYHAFDVSKYVNKILKKIDHIMIFILIAGSYTPICIIALPKSIGIKLLFVIWLFAVFGIILKIFWVTCPKWFSSIVYISMGWVCIFALPQIIKKLPKAGFIWLLVGGVIYTIGGVIYAIKFKKLDEKFKHFGGHEIFHIFVILGSLCHYIVMFGYLPVS